MNLRIEAASHGVRDLEAALSFMDASTTAPASNLSLGAKYVEVLLKLKSLDNMDHDKVFYPLLIPKNAGMVAHAAANNPRAHVSLRLCRADFQAKLGLAPGSDWAEDRQEYKDGLQELIRHQKQKYALLVENQVFKRVLLLKEKARAQSGHNADKLAKRLLNMNSNIQNLLGIYFTWDVFGTDRPRTQVMQQHLRDAFNRQFPWSHSSGDGENRAGAPNGSEEAQKYFALRYHTAKHQLKRTEEEVEILKEEVVRLFNWCEERLELVNERIGVFGSKIAELVEANSLDGITPEEQALRLIELRILEGKHAVHLAELRRLQCIYRDAGERWKHLVPMHPETATPAAAAES